MVLIGQISDWCDSTYETLICGTKMIEQNIPGTNLWTYKLHSDNLKQQSASQAFILLERQGKLIKVYFDTFHSESNLWNSLPPEIRPALASERLQEQHCGKLYWYDLKRHNTADINAEKVNAKTIKLNIGLKSMKNKQLCLICKVQYQ